MARPAKPKPPVRALQATGAEPTGRQLGLPAANPNVPLVRGHFLEGLSLDGGCTSPTLVPRRFTPARNSIPQPIPATTPKAVRRG